MAIEQEIRLYLAKRFKCDPNIDVQVHGDIVDVNGIMPNTQAHGFFRAGNLNDIASDMRRESTSSRTVEV